MGNGVDGLTRIFYGAPAAGLAHFECLEGFRDMTQAGMLPIGILEMPSLTRLQSNPNR